MVTLHVLRAVALLAQSAPYPPHEMSDIAALLLQPDFLKRKQKDAEKRHMAVQADAQSSDVVEVCSPTVTRQRRPRPAEVLTLQTAYSLHLSLLHALVEASACSSERDCDFVVTCWSMAALIKLSHCAPSSSCSRRRRHHHRCHQWHLS